jgi:hypothetical protein
VARAYTPGLKVAARTRYVAERRLPIEGTVPIAAGDVVTSDQVVARTDIPGDITPVNLANLLGVPASDLAECMLVGEGDTVEEGQPLARTRGIFGMFRSERASPASGTIEAVSAVTGQVILRGAPLPLELDAFVAGIVRKVIPGEGCFIETDATLVQGILGVGGETHGRLRMVGRVGENLTDALITADMADRVVVGGARVSAAALAKAREVGVAALVVGGIDAADLEKFLGYDLGVAITGNENLGLTLILTEGFGDIAMAGRTFELLRSREGEEAAVNGKTQIRAGVMRPEIVVPFPGPAAGGTEETPADMGQELDVGVEVRIVREPWFGRIGRVSALPHELRVLESGARARVVEVELASGEGVIIPRANVELIQR